MLLPVFQKKNIAIVEQHLGGKIPESSEISPPWVFWERDDIPDD